MKGYGRLFYFGFISWLLGFLTSMALSPLRESRLLLFETVMGLVLTVSTVLFTIQYFSDVRRSHLPEGLRLGLSFLFVNILCDMCVLMWGLMPRSLAEYFMDVGLAYLSMPMITLGFAYALRRSRRSRHFWEKQQEEKEVESDSFQDAGRESNMHSIR